MKTYAIPFWVIISIFSFIMILMGSILWFVWEFIKKKLLDRIIFIDKNNRWSEHSIKIKGKKTAKLGNNEYVFQPESALLNYKGKALYIFPEGKSAPLHIEYNRHEWLDSKSIMAVLQNKMVQQIVKPTDKLVDLLIIFGAIGGILAFISSGINTLIATGVIKP